MPGLSSLCSKSHSCIYLNRLDKLETKINCLILPIPIKKFINILLNLDVFFLKTVFTKIFKKSQVKI